MTWSGCRGWPCSVKGPTEAALHAVWALLPGQSAREALLDLRLRYAFVLAEGLHDAIYEFVRRELRSP